MLRWTDPKSRRATTGSTVSSSTVVITSARANVATVPAAAPGQVAPAISTAATANSSTRPTRRQVRISPVTSRSPPARQASRGRPGGTASASVQSASAHSPRPIGSSHTTHRPAAAATRPSLLIPCLRPP